MRVTFLLIHYIMHSVTRENVCQIAANVSVREVVLEMIFSFPM